jgi:hypothetical protein
VTVVLMMRTEAKPLDRRPPSSAVIADAIEDFRPSGITVEWDDDDVGVALLVLRLALVLASTTLPIVSAIRKADTGVIVMPEPAGEVGIGA